MSMLFALGLGTGIFCGIWGLISLIPSLGLITWIGFAGCTAYFGSGKHGLEGVKTSIFATMSGMLSAMVAMYVSGFIPGSIVLTAFMTGLISATMCWQARAKALWFIPGAFMGCFSTFGAAAMGLDVLGADLWRIVVSFLCGAILALCCDKSGEWFFEKFGKKEELETAE
ncbi:MAG: DUF1097 domain-containing protein [Peptostreptococcus sp.]|uniref:DUF1097 domain-containing protein n=1 Tax=Peptostreptococcus sp. TaxID=1262 RepID=UPI002FC5E28C